MSKTSLEDILYYSDYFDARAVIGRKISILITKRGLHKNEICKNAGISRPTFDKFLAGEINNARNYDEYLKKIAKAASIDLRKELNPAPMKRAGNIETFRKLFCSDYKYISEKLGYSADELKKWETGEVYPTKGQLMELAILYGTSVSNLEGREGYSYYTTAEYERIKEEKSYPGCTISGFWGHLGLQVPGREHILWYPITEGTMQGVYKCLQDENELIVFPCTNNKLVLINKTNLERIIFLDDDCSEYEGDWEIDAHDYGDIPIDYYRIFEELAFEEEDEEWIDNEIPQHLINEARAIIKENNWDNDFLHRITGQARIIFPGGKENIFSIGYISKAASYLDSIRNGEKTPWQPLIIEEMEGFEEFVNPKRISILELPLLKAEEALDAIYEELLKDSESKKFFEEEADEQKSGEE